MNLLLPCLYSFLGCVGYCFAFNIRMRKLMLLFASLGGAAGWCVYLLTPWLGSDIVRYFAATLAVSFYAEIMARIYRVPATIYLIVGLIPLVPGAGIYYTMEYAVSGDMDLFMETGMRTLGTAGALALGILLVSSGMRAFLSRSSKS